MEKQLQEDAETKPNWYMPMGLIRFLGWWLAFFGLYSSSSVCPF